ncbi:MAG: phospho-N-acetylmuramoyl-pentapeptide-transferase [Clostridia bacterium]|nr:phospho-N-acetylmuramoyl-pentapeptide-transferase [Clostridia bacterium]
MKFQVSHAYFLTAAAVFLLTVLISRYLIPKLRSLKMGQKILDIGPRWHKSKEGTPTMGGLAFIAASLLSVILLWGALFAVTGSPLAIFQASEFLITLLFAVVCGLIGIIDDAVKITKKQNAGLSAAQKFLLQLLSAVLYVFVMHACGFIDTTLRIPFLGWEWELGILYYVVAVILITGVVNSVNITDGIDGLASTETFVVGAFFTVVAFFSGTQLSSAQIGSNLSLALGAAVAVGASLGFLIYNFYPARVFMGDTGSLFFGGLVVGCAFMADNPLIILFAGLAYIIETASVMIQTTYFKYTRFRFGEGRRIFRMSPIHHHFEMCGWNEIRIVSVFGGAAALFCALTYLLDYVL